MTHTKITLVLATILFMYVVPAPFAHAQAVTTPYWCGSYWSSLPCSYGGNYNNNYNNNYNYNYGYNYPNNYSYYYPSNYYYPYTYYNYTSPAPSCTITATNSYYNSYYLPTGQAGNYYGYYNNQPVTLSWSSNDATYAYIYPDIGRVSTYGSTTAYPSGNTTYTMTVSGSGGTNTCQTTYYQPMTYNQQYYYQYPYNYYQYPYLMYR